MRIRIPAFALLAALTMAAAPAPKPVITIDGVTKAVSLDIRARTALARNVTDLNGALEKVVALHQDYQKASAAEREQIVKQMSDIHAQCKALHDAIVKQLDPAQQRAYFQYLHAQLKAAGIDMTELQHGGMMPGDMHHHDSLPGA